VAFTYTKLNDFILDQLLGFSNLNALKNSVRYLGETILGDPAANSDKVSAAAANSIRSQTTRTVTTDGTDPGVGGVSQSWSTVIYSNSSAASFSDVTYGGHVTSVTLTTSGRPVMISLQPDASENACYLSASKNGTASMASIEGWVQIVRGAVIRWFIVGTHWNPADTSTNHAINGPPNAVCWIDAVAAGTYTWTLRSATSSVTSYIQIGYCRLVAYEI